MVDKIGIKNRLMSVGLHQIADAYRDKTRLLSNELSDAKTSTAKKANNEKSWEEMWELFRPVVMRLEKRMKGEHSLEKNYDNVDEFLDPEYSETDNGKRIRDGLIWVAEEISRVVTYGDVPSIDLTKAKRKPPNPFAILCLETYALKPDKHTELISKVIAFADKTHDPADHGGSGGDSFLDEID